MLAKPIMGAVADRFRIKKLLFIIFQIITAAALLPINYIPKIPTDVSKVHFACDNGAAVVDTSPLKSAKDKCLLQNINLEKGSNSTMRCQLDCMMENSVNWFTVEEYWMGHSHMERKKQFQFEARLPVDKIDEMDGIYYFPVQSILANNHTSKPICPNETYALSTLCNMECDSASLNKFLTTKQTESLESVTGFYQFWIFFLMAIFTWVGMAVIVSIGDAICFEMLGKPTSLILNLICVYIYHKKY